MDVLLTFLFFLFSVFTSHVNQDLLLNNLNNIAAMPIARMSVKNWNVSPGRR